MHQDLGFFDMLYLIATTPVIGPILCGSLVFSAVALATGVYVSRNGIA